MKPMKQFLNQPRHFWANVRTISEQIGYTNSRTGQIKIPSLPEIAAALRAERLSVSHIVDRYNFLTEFGEDLFLYFTHRADILNDFVESRLMDVEQARLVFYE